LIPDEFTGYFAVALSRAWPLVQGRHLAARPADGK
jgi:hypothetical protein